MSGIAWEAYAPRLSVDWIRQEPGRRHRRIHGGLLFLDVSGFTALSEMLASLGRVGAEEITEVIGETFERLLEPGYRDGGSMLKFGGDALLLLFEGDHAGARAARAAMTMMDVLLESNPVVTRAGQIDLGMTVGVHEGDVDLVLAGQQSRELFVLGPAATEVIRVEGSAERGQVLVSRSLAATLDPGVLGAAVGHGIELVGAPSAPEPAGLTAPKPGVPEARELVPADVAAHLESGAVEGEHRTATVAFLHFDGTDEILASEGPEAMAAAVDELVRVVHGACHDAGVCLLASDVDADGGKLIVTAGVPRSRGDDADRLLLALRAIVEAPRRLDVKIGVARGPIFAGAVGPPYRRTFTILGDTVNLAARVMARAEPDEILATAEPINAARTLFELVDREPFLAKGKSLPVRSARIGPEIGIRLRLRPDDHAFVGRHAELEQLERMVAGLATGSGRVAVLSGAAGIGKSRLIDELQHTNPRLAFALAACQEAAQERPFYAVAQFVRTVVGGDRTASDQAVLDAATALLSSGGAFHVGHLPLLGVVLGLDLPETEATRAIAPQFRMPRTRELIAWVLRAATSGPLALVAEDVQWMDPESAAFVSELGPLLSRQPWLLILTSRDPESVPPLSCPPDVARVDFELGDLDADDARALVLQDVEKHRIPMDRVDDIVARSGGNPLFLSEIVAAVSAGADASDELEQVLGQRLDMLSGSDRRILGQAAVLGVEFPPALLASVAGPDAVSEHQLHRLRDFIRPMRSGPLRFNQTLYQEVAYATIPFRRREELHAKAARAIEASDGTEPERVEQLSRHWHLAGEPARAWPYSIAAADHAATRHAPTTAARLYRRALEDGRAAGQPVEELGRAELSLGMVLDRSGSYGAAATVYEEALDHVARSGRPEVHWRLAAATEKLGEYERSLEWLDAAEYPDDESRYRGLVQRALVLNRLGRFVEAREAATEAGQSEDPLTCGRATWALSWAHFGLGEPVAQDVARDAIERLEQVGAIAEAAKALVSLGAALYRAGDWDGAVAAYERSAAHEDRIGDRVNTAIPRLNIAEILSDQGRLDEARPLLESAFRVFSAAHHPAAIGFAAMHLGRLAARMGDHEQAERHLADALATFLEIEAASLAPEARARQAEAALFSGQYQVALDRCEGVLDDPADEALTPMVRRVAACAAWFLGRHDDARRLFDGAKVSAQELGLPYERVLIDAAAALLLASDPPAPEQVGAFGIVDLPRLALGPDGVSVTVGRAGRSARGEFA